MSVRKGGGIAVRAWNLSPRTIARGSRRTAALRAVPQALDRHPLAMFAIAASLLPVIALSTTLVALYGLNHPLERPGIDLEIVRELGKRWLDAGTMYLGYQLDGPYSIDVTWNLTLTPALYPPAVGPLFALVTLLPWPVAAILWWGVPLAIVGVAFARWRPRPWSWPLLALCLANEATPTQLMVGGTTLWVTAAVAASLRWRTWISAVILLKPTFLPFALIGVRNYRWWIISGSIVTLTVLGSWHEYLTVAANARADGLWYSVPALPVVAIPVIGWLARRRTER